MYYSEKYTVQMVLDRCIFEITSNCSLNVRLSMKSACPDSHFHMLFIVKLDRNGQI